MAKKKKQEKKIFAEYNCETIEELELDCLRKYLRNEQKDKYKTKVNFFTELIDRNSKNGTIISEIKETQWRITNYSVLLNVAAVGAIQLSKDLNTSLTYKIVLTIIIAIINVLIYFVSFRMMEKTEEDLDFYRQHSRVNEDMLNITTGLQNLANRIVSSRRPDLAPKHDFDESALQNRKIFSKWLFRIILGAGIVSFVISAALLWVGLIGE